MPSRWLIAIHRYTSPLMTCSTLLFCLFVVCSWEALPAVDCNVHTYSDCPVACALSADDSSGLLLAVPPGCCALSVGDSSELLLGVP